MDKILIIIPAYNEEENIQRVLDEIQKVCFPHDVVVVNDASEDRTESIAEISGLNILSHPVNLGAGATIQTGLKYAHINNYDLAVIIDGDGQHDPREIPKMIKALNENCADVVIGSRFLTKIKSEENKIHWARRIGIKIFSTIASFICRSKITDTTSGFRAFNRKAIGFLSQDMPSDFPDGDLILSLKLSGFKVIEVPVSIRERLSGKSMYSFLRSVYYPFKIIIAILVVLLKNCIGKWFK